MESNKIHNSPKGEPLKMSLSLNNLSGNVSMKKFISLTGDFWNFNHILSHVSEKCSFYRLIIKAWDTIFSETITLCGHVQGNFIRLLFEWKEEDKFFMPY